MLIFGLIVIAMVGFWPLLKRLEKNHFNVDRKVNIKLIYCIVCAIALVAIAGLRSPSTNFGDDKMYMGNFEYVQRMDFPKVYEQFKKQDTEPVFYLLAKVVSLVSTNYNVFLIVCAIPVAVAISWLIYKRSKIPVLSFLIFGCAFFYLWSLVVLRQAVALSFIVVAFEFLLRKKYWRFIIAVIVAALFHRTALVFLVALPVSFIPYKRKSLLIFAVVSIIALVFGEGIINAILQPFSNMQHYSAYLNRDASFGNWQQILKYFIYTGMTIAAMVMAKNEFRKKNSTSIYLCLLGCLLCALSPFFAETFRLALYLMVPIVVLLPNAIAEVKEKNMRMLYSVLLAIALIILGSVTFYSMGYASVI